MRILIKIIGNEDVADVLHRAVLDEDGAEDHLFGLDVLRGELLERDFFLEGHGLTS